MQPYDCVVVGGGPAGSTVGALLAERGHRVLIVERARFPRFHIGESLMPETYWVFKRLGMLDKLRNSPFVKKYSVQFVGASGRESQPFFFDEMNPHECSQTWQVVRSEFDEMMLNNAAERGCEVWQEANVTEFVLAPSPIDDLPRAVGVRVSRGGAPAEFVPARIVVDATGTNALLSRRLGIRQPDPMLKKASIFAHFRGVYRDPGKNAGATLVLSTRNQDGWFWSIPLPDDVTSIGVVGAIESLIGQRSGRPEQTLMDEVSNCPGLVDRMKNAERISDVHVLSDFSYRASRCAGDGWVLVGDAFGFLDPMYSSGVFLALKSGEMAADCIHDALTCGDPTPQKLAAWGQALSGGMQAIRKLVYAFYTKGFSFGAFVREHPTTKKNLVDLLIGNVFYDGVEQIFQPMSRMVDLPPAIPLADPAGVPA